jgi:hypothetical protein
MGWERGRSARSVSSSGARYLGTRRVGRPTSRSTYAPVSRDEATSGNRVLRSFRIGLTLRPIFVLWVLCPSRVRDGVPENPQVLAPIRSEWLRRPAQELLASFAHKDSMAPSAGGTSASAEPDRTSASRSACGPSSKHELVCLDYAMTVRFPRALRPGDRVGVTSPSAGVGAG